MKRKNLNKIRFSLILLLTLINCRDFSQPVMAQSPMQIGPNNSKIRTQLSKKQESGSDKGRPTRRKAMGSRNDCPATKIPLTALIPENKVGKVVEKNPTFWFFIPYKPNRMLKGEFILQDAAHNEVYRADLSIKKGGGIFGINLPSETSLKKDKIYQWYFKLYCDAPGDALQAYRDKSSIAIYVRGWVQRVVLQARHEKQLNAASSSPSECMAIYAENDIWYSALTKLAKLRQANPQNQVFARYWLQLLSDVDLQELSNMPIVGNIN